MEEDQYDFLGDDGELLPRKPKPVEGITFRNAVIIVILASLVAAVTGSVVTFLLASTMNITANETTSIDLEIALASTIDSMQLTQVAIADSANFVNSLATQAAFMAQSRPEPTPTQLPPDQCYCDNQGCRPESALMKSGDTFDTLGIESRNPDEFAWYLVRNLSETSGVHWEVYPADHEYTCEAHWNNCQVRGFYTTRECVLSQKYQVCDDLSNCRFAEPLLDQE